MEIITKTGTDIKIAVNLSCGGLTMDDFDFTCDFYTSQQKSVTISKSEMKREDANSYIAVIPTEEMTSGNIRMLVTAQIPDTDCDDGIRTEIATTDTGIAIRK